MVKYLEDWQRKDGSRATLSGARRLVAGCKQGGGYGTSEPLRAARSFARSLPGVRSGLQTPG